MCTHTYTGMLMWHSGRPTDSQPIYSTVEPFTVGSIIGEVLSLYVARIHLNEYMAINNDGYCVRIILVA